MIGRSHQHLHLGLTVGNSYVSQLIYREEDVQFVEIRSPVVLDRVDIFL